MPARRFIVACLGLMALACPASVAAADISPQSVSAALAGVVANNHSIQWDLPVFPVGSGSVLPSEGFAPRPLPPRPPVAEETDIELPSWLRDVLIAFAVVLVAIVLWSEWRRFSRRARRVTEGEDGADAAASVPEDPDEVSPAAAERLAAAGAYGQATHMLLHLCLLDLAARQQLSRAWTTREIVRRAQLSRAMREPLAALARTVEVTLFGGRSADGAAYAACRTHFERFGQAMRGGS